MVKTLLIVDDDSLIAENLEAYLEDEGYKVLLATSGEEALELLKQPTNQVDLGIINMRLPGMNGNDVMEAIMVSYPKIQFLVHTGATDYTLPEAFLAKGLSEDCVMIKPVLDMQSFKSKIEARLAKT